MGFAPGSGWLAAATVAAIIGAAPALRAETVAPAAPAVRALDVPAWRTGLQPYEFQGDARSFSHDEANRDGLVRWRTDEVILPQDGTGAISKLTLSTGESLRGPTGAPLFAGPAGDASRRFDLNYTRGWPAAVAFDSGRYRLDLTPHAGVGLTSEGGSAEAGATLRFGQKPDHLKRFGLDGRRFGGDGRWYLFAAAKGRALGYNFMKGDDGWKRSGVSTDTGAFVGDQQAGVAWRKGDLQASFGWARRKVTSPGAISGSMHQEMVGFQLSIKPQP